LRCVVKTFSTRSSVTCSMRHSNVVPAWHASCLYF
jgi:hypothetical protein